MNSQIVIDNIFAGIQESEYFGRQGQYSSGYGVDPDMPKDDSSLRPSGLIRPTALSKFSASEITGVPLWLVTNPKTDKTYCYANDGKVHTIDSDLTMGTALNGGTALSASSGNGAVYYDNYIYFAKNTDIARYGPLNGSASLTQDYWTNTLSLTALADTTYPSVRGVELPNHLMYHDVQGDQVFFGDVNSDNQGVLHKIKTSKTTVEGDTNNGSTYESLNFDTGYYPTAIEGYGSDIVTALVDGTNTTIKQRPAALAFWDTSSSSYSKIIQRQLPDPLVTAMKNINGILYVFSGNASGGFRILTFAGGYSFNEIYQSDDGLPPYAGAVDGLLTRLVWGGYITDPATVAVVSALGSRKQAIPSGVHNIFKATSAGANPHVTCLKYIEHDGNPTPIIGWSDDSGKGLDKVSTTYGTSVWRSGLYRIGQNFQVMRVHIPFAQAIAANMTITPKIYYDEGSRVETLSTISNAKYSASQRYVSLDGKGKGVSNFFIELTWSGSALLTVGLPITIELDILDE